MRPAPPDLQRLDRLLSELGIDRGLIEARTLPLYAEARRLCPIGLGTDLRDKLLTPSAARAWLAMQRAARSEGVSLSVVSAFRSYDYQALLIRQKLERGRGLDEILQLNAPPGCSEHHTGRALDIGTADCPPVDEAFEQTAAFRWLTENAARFGFHLSYRRENPYGYLYEPWHWSLNLPP